MLKILKKYPELYPDTDDSLKTKDFALKLVKENPNALDHLGEYQKDKDVVLESAIGDFHAFQFADESLKKNQNFILELIKKTNLYYHNYWYIYYPESKKSGKNYARYIEREAGVIQYADKNLSKDKVFLLEALGLYNRGYVEIKDDRVYRSLYKNDQSFIKEHAKRNRTNWIYGFADKSLKRDPEMLMSLFQGISQEESVKLSKNLTELNIDFPERFDLDTLKVLIKNRKNVDKKGIGPLAVAIYSKNDESSSFQYNQIRQLIDRGYNIIYFEADNESEVYDSLKSATINVQRRADLFVLGGHGTQTRTAMGAEDPATYEMKNEKYYIDISDEKEIMDIRDSLAQDSVVILESCSTGQGEEGAENVANMMMRIFPQSRVFAPVKPAYVEKYEYDENGKVINVVNSEGKDASYSTGPRK